MSVAGPGQHRCEVIASSTGMRCRNRAFTYIIVAADAAAPGVAVWVCGHHETMGPPVTHIEEWQCRDVADGDRAVKCVECWYVRGTCPEHMAVPTEAVDA